MKILVSLSSGTDDPTRAALGMLSAKAAAEQGHDVLVWLQGEAAVIANRNVYPFIHGVNMPPMENIVDALIARNVPVWVCEACARGRNVTPQSLIPTATLKGMGDFVAAATARDRIIAV
jgi:sulfur relay (sulfurtransferase) complex TusBCD TusD component (DsrE family)